MFLKSVEGLCVERRYERFIISHSYTGRPGSKLRPVNQSSWEVVQCSGYSWTAEGNWSCFWQGRRDDRTCSQSRVTVGPNGHPIHSVLGVPSPVRIAVEAWSWPLTCTSSRASEWMELCIHSEIYVYGVYSDNFTFAIVLAGVFQFPALSRTLGHDCSFSYISQHSSRVLCLLAR
jgi:hypothetical protein